MAHASLLIGSFRSLRRALTRRPRRGDGSYNKDAQDIYEMILAATAVKVRTQAGRRHRFARQ